MLSAGFAVSLARHNGSDLRPFAPMRFDTQRKALV